MCTRGLMVWRWTSDPTIAGSSPVGCGVSFCILDLFAPYHTLPPPCSWSIQLRLPRSSKGSWGVNACGSSREKSHKHSLLVVVLGCNDALRAEH